MSSEGKSNHFLAQHNTKVSINQEVKLSLAAPNDYTTSYWDINHTSILNDEEKTSDELKRAESKATKYRRCHKAAPPFDKSGL